MNKKPDLPFRIDLTNREISRSCEFFPSAVAVLSLPDVLGPSLAMLVWGVTIHEPELYPALWAALPDSVQQSCPASVFLSGWGDLTIEGTRGGECSFNPYVPSLDFKEFRLQKGSDGREVSITRTWPCDFCGSSTRYRFDLILEQPLGYLSLLVHASGPVTLSIHPSDLIGMDTVHQLPDQYRYDWTRSRQRREREAGSSWQECVEAESPTLLQN